MKKMDIASLVGNSRVVHSMSTIIMLFGILLLCLIWVGLFYMINSERQKEINSAFKEAANYAHAFEEHTLRTIKGADQAVLFLKYEYERRGQDIDILSHINEGRLEPQSVVLLSVADENGDLAASSQAPLMTVNIEDREHFLVHKNFYKNQLYISKPIQGRVSGKWSIQMTRRINKPDGAFGGVAIVSMDPFYFTEVYKNIDLGENSSITLVGRDGIIRARQSSHNAGVGLDMTDSALMKKLAVSEAGSYIHQSPIDGIKRIYSYRALREYPFVVLVGIDEEEVLHNVNERIAGYYFVARVVTFVILLFIVVLLGITARQKRDAQALRQVNDTLESTVQERTQDLFAANQELTAMNEEHIAMNEELQHINQALEEKITAHRQAEEELGQKNKELESAYAELKNAQSKVIHQEKMASIGQLAAGVAHEINNPLGFVLSNFEILRKYMRSLVKMVDTSRELHKRVLDERIPSLQENAEQLSLLVKQKKIDYILQDVEPIFSETNDGLKRVGDIVKALRLFSRGDQIGQFEDYDLNEGIRNTLIVSRNEVKYIAEVKENLTEVPVIRAVGGQINQVILNIILNAAYAIKAKKLEDLGVITIKTYADEQFIYCSIEDNGVGIPEKNKKDIFNPFFTTKPVGQGTGLGLSISYDIIVNKHQGSITCVSKENAGTAFLIRLPLTTYTGKAATA